MASEKILAMIEEVKGLSVLELNELVKALEEEFGVSAAAGLYQSVLCFLTITICNKLVKKVDPDYALY